MAQDRPQELPASGAESQHVLRLLILPYLYTSLLFYAVVQVQESVLGKVYVMHQHVRLVGLVGALMGTAAYVLQGSRVRIRRPTLVTFSLAYCAFVVFDLGLKLARGTVQPSAAVYAETYLYFFVFLIPLMLVMSDNESSGQSVIIERGAFRALYLAAIPVFALGYAQVLLNAPILSLGDEAAGYVVQVPTRSDIGQVRAFSLFGSGFTYGHFVTLVGALAASYLVLRGRPLRRGWFVALVVGSALAAASTLTRNTYVEFVVSVGAVVVIPFLLRKGWTNRLLVSASAGFAATAYGAMVAFFLLVRLHARGLLNLSTFEIRLTNVAAIVERYIVGASTLTTLVFGQGYIQGEKFADLQGIHRLLFDNTYVDVLLFSGVVGLVLFAAFFVAMFGYALDRFRRTGAYWWLALSGMYFSYPLVAAANIYTSELYLISCMVIAYDMLARRRMGSPNRNAESRMPAEPVMQH